MMLGADQYLHPLAVTHRCSIKRIAAGLHYAREKIVALGNADHQIVDLRRLQVCAI